jgi:hypothetical protein
MNTAPDAMTIIAAADRLLTARRAAIAAYALDSGKTAAERAPLYKAADDALEALRSIVGDAEAYRICALT